MRNSKNGGTVNNKNTIGWVEGVDVPGALPATAREWGERLFGPRPLAIRALIAVRNAVMRPFGVEPFASRSGERGRSGPAFLGPFPVLEETPRRIDFGIADSHLSFRCSLVVRQNEQEARIEVTTVVDTHNACGRLYATGLRLGHPLVMRVFLGRLSRTWSNV
jgi:hypothetical protein